MEFAEWQAFYRLSPWGDERADLRAGIIASTVANVHRDRKSRSYKPADFIPRYGPVRPQSPGVLLAKMQAFAAVHNQAVSRQP